jgi:hypothetical protein
MLRSSVTPSESYRAGGEPASLSKRHCSSGQKDHGSAWHHMMDASEMWHFPTGTPLEVRIEPTEVARPRPCCWATISLRASVCNKWYPPTSGRWKAARFCLASSSSASTWRRQAESFESSHRGGPRLVEGRGRGSGCGDETGERNDKALMRTARQQHYDCRLKRAQIRRRLDSMRKLLCSTPRPQT